MVSIADIIITFLLLSKLVLTIAEDNLPEASVASKPTMALQTWCLCLDSPKRSARSKTNDCM